jgi:hypothetical protein
MSGPAHALCEIDDTDSLDAWERALLDRQLETLDRLAELGLAVAAAVKDRVTAPEAADTVVQHAALDFARVSRAVRMTLPPGPSRLPAGSRWPGSARRKGSRSAGCAPPCGVGPKTPPWTPRRPNAWSARPRNGSNAMMSTTT